MGKFVHVFIKADTKVRLPRDVAEAIVREGLGEYEPAPTDMTAVRSTENQTDKLPESAREVTDDG